VVSVGVCSAYAVRVQCVCAVGVQGGVQGECGCGCAVSVGVQWVPLGALSAVPGGVPHAGWVGSDRVAVGRTGGEDK
jgi:hypothetical protein